MSNVPLLSLEEVSVCFPTDDGPAYAVNNLSFSIQPGEVLGLVGESGFIGLPL